MSHHVQYHNCSFSVALHHLKKGKRICRPHWNGQTLILRENFIEFVLRIDKEGNNTRSCLIWRDEDILSNDWQVLSD